MIESRKLTNTDCRSLPRSRRFPVGVEVLESRLVPSYFPPTSNGIGVFEDQLPGGLSNALVQFLATHTDGTQKILLNEIEQFRAINPDYTLLQYQLGTGNSPYDYVINNQWSSDWSYVNSQESWFAHQTYSGEPQSESDLSSGRVGNSTGWDQADIANSAWQQYTLQQVVQNMAATDANGWFADSFQFGIGGAGYDSPIPTRYQGTNAANPAAWPGGIDWTDQLANWSQIIETAFAQSNAANGTDYQFIPNLGQLVTSWEPDWWDNANGVPFIDGAFLEGFGQYTDSYDWAFSMNAGLNFTTNDKIIIMQPYLQDTPDSPTGQQERNFYLGTYLLLKGSETYLDMDYGGFPQYFPEYELNLGAATTPLPSNVSSYLWDGVYRRDFQNGFVLVNPGSTTNTLALGGNYQEVQGHGGGTLTDADLDANGNYVGGNLTYQNVSTVTLAGGSAAIFVFGSPPSVTNVVINQNIPALYNAAGQPAAGVQRSMVDDIVYTFSEPVNIASPSVDPNVFNISVALGWTGTVPTLNWAAVAGTNDTEWAVNFSGAGVLGGSIANGAYTITITDPDSITAVSDGQTLSLVTGGIGSATQSFYRLFGDINGDEVVNPGDNNEFKQAMTTYNAAFDFNQDGIVNPGDNNKFKADLSVNFTGFTPTI